MRRWNPPGVIEGVPFSRAGIATVSCVVAAHSGAWVVGHCVQVVHCIYCNERGATTHSEPSPFLWSQQRLQNPTNADIFDGRTSWSQGFKEQDSLLFSEANSRRSRSFMGKLTKVDSLLVRRASENRFRSGWDWESRKRCCVCIATCSTAVWKVS